MMSGYNIIGVIPARYASSRFPGKPLADISGKPMVWWVYQNAKKSKYLEDVIVATDDSRIMDKCNELGIKSILTSSEHVNGTERLSEVAEHIVSKIYITIQGDEPLIEPESIDKVIEIIISDDSVECATLKTKFTSPIDVINSTTPKVVTDLHDNILLISRSPIPYPKAALNYSIYKPLGTYAFKRDILLKYRNMEMGPLEKAEEIELLRLLENGYKVRIGTVSSETIAVDTQKDLDRVREIIKNRQ